MILVALGSNQGDRDSFLARACVALEAASISILKRSHTIETPALLPADAPPAWDRPYLNQVIEIATMLEPLALLHHMKAIEKELGRIERGRWAPREIDLDLLAYHDVVLDTPELTLPHAGLARRTFVLVPLVLIAPDWHYPAAGEFFQMTPKQLLERLST